MPSPKRYTYRILYVGRDHALLEFLQDALSRLDCFVVRCPRGSEARSFIAGIDYSLLLFDDELPDISGSELEKLARQFPHREHTPIIIIKRSDDFDSLIETIKKRLGERA